MKFTKSLLTALLASLLTCTAMAETRKISGVKVEDSTSISGTALALNGAGIRYKAIFKVYVAALY